MKSIDELDHYELLEVATGATPADIDRAYRTAQQTYSEGSLAVYSVFEGRDVGAIRDQLDEAYRVLADPELREVYDREVKVDEKISDSGVDLPAGASMRPLASNALAVDSVDSVFSDFEDSALEASVEEFETFDENAGGDFDGTRLRKTRLFRGYEIEDISDVTKVSGAHLRNIEEENFEDLPADVYVRGFVTAYAKTIGLDPHLVVPSYMSRVQQSREDGPRGGFLGRR